MANENKGDLKENDGMITIVQRHVYDIDVFEILDDLRQKISKPGYEVFAERLKEFDFIQQDEGFFVEEMHKQGIDISENQKFRNYVLSSDQNLYYVYLGWKLVLFDIYKIEALLSYQSVLFSGNYYAPKENFVGLVEFLVYDFVKNKVFPGEEVRLEKIMNWIERNRKFNIEKAYSDGNKVKKRRKKIKAPKFRTVSMDPEFADILFQKLKNYFSEDQHTVLFDFIVCDKKVNCLCFNGNINSIVELFKRLRYNKKLNVRSNEILAKWIVDHFCVKNLQGSVVKLKNETVLDILKRYKNEPAKGNRILEEIAPHQTPHQRKEAKANK